MTDTNELIKAIQHGEVEVYELGRNEVRRLMDGEHSNATDELLDAAQGEADTDSMAVIVVRGEELA